MVVRWFVASLIRVRFSMLTPFAPLRKLAKRVDLESTVSEFDSLGEYQFYIKEREKMRIVRKLKFKKNSKWNTSFHDMMKWTRQLVADGYVLHIINNIVKRMQKEDKQIEIIKYCQTDYTFDIFELKIKSNKRDYIDFCISFSEELSGWISILHM